MPCPVFRVSGRLTSHAQAIEGPTKTNQIPRQVPPMTGSLRTIPSILLTGILPFGAIFVELYFIMTSLWTNKIYYMFGFLFLCYGLMIITSAATTILLTYFLLCAENYRWHWRAFAGAGMTGGYVFVNALIFWATRVSFGGLTGAVLYVGYSALIGFVVFILTGEFNPHRPSRLPSLTLRSFSRFDWLLCQLGIHPPHLWVHQGRLSLTPWAGGIALRIAQGHPPGGPSFAPVLIAWRRLHTEEIDCALTIVVDLLREKRTVYSI